MSHVRWSVAVLEEQHPRIVTVDGGREVDVRIAGDCDSVARAGIFGEIEEDAFADHLASGGALQSGTVQKVKPGCEGEATRDEPLDAAAVDARRSAERREGQKRASPCRSRWWPYD